MDEGNVAPLLQWNVIQSFFKKKEEILPFATTLMDHEGITLSKITQRKTNIYNVTYMRILKKLNSPKHKLEW